MPCVDQYTLIEHSLPNKTLSLFIYFNKTVLLTLKIFTIEKAHSYKDVSYNILTTNLNHEHNFEHKLINQILEYCSIA